MAAPHEWTFMPAPEPTPDCPPGLEYLTTLDQLIVRQEVEVLEILFNVDTANRYRVCNAQGQQIWFAAEEQNCCAQVMCGPIRPFVVIVTDQMGVPIMRIERDFKICAQSRCLAFCDPCQHSLVVEAPPGNPVGYVRQTVSCLTPRFDILDASENPVFYVVGPLCTSECFNLDFQLFSYNDPEVMIGKITKKIESYLLEMFTNADTFGVMFPVDLDVKLKATIFAAVFLIDFMFFEHKVQDNNERRRDDF